METFVALLTVGPMIVIAFWVVQSLLIAWLAAEKGRDAIGWGFLGLFLGPLALLTLGFAPRGTYSKYARCSECRELVSIGSARCAYCRTEFTDVVPLEENPYLSPPR